MDPKYWCCKKKLNKGFQTIYGDMVWKSFQLQLTFAEPLSLDSVSRMLLMLELVWLEFMGHFKPTLSALWSLHLPFCEACPWQKLVGSMFEAEDSFLQVATWRKKNLRLQSQYVNWILKTFKCLKGHRHSHSLDLLFPYNLTSVH